MLSAAGNIFYVLLSHKPTKIEYVYGFVQEKVKVGTFPSGRDRMFSRFQIISEGGQRTYSLGKYQADNWILGETTSSGTKLFVSEVFRKYDRETRKNRKTGKDDKAPALTVSYDYNKVYDPIYATLEDDDSPLEEA